MGPGPIFEIIEHTADVGLRIFGEDLETLFSNAGVGFFELITEIEKVGEKESVDFSVEAENRKELLVRWLSELHFKFEVDRLLFRRFKVSNLKEKSLSATAYGERFDPARHELRTEIKGVTYHQLKLEPAQEGWVAEVIFDV